MDVQTNRKLLGSAQEAMSVPGWPAAAGVAIQVARGEHHGCLHRHRLGRLPKDKKKHQRRVRAPWQPYPEVMVVHPEQYSLKQRRGGVQRSSPWVRNRPGTPKPLQRPRRQDSFDSVDRLDGSHRSLFQAGPREAEAPGHPHLVGATSRAVAKNRVAEGRRTSQSGRSLHKALDHQRPAGVSSQALRLRVQERKSAVRTEDPGDARHKDHDGGGVWARRTEKSSSDHP